MKALKLATFLLALICIAPFALAYDANPVVTYFTNTYIESTSTATFFGGASDFGDNAGMKRIVLYEDNTPIYTKWCNTAATACDLSYSVSHGSPQSHTYRIRAWDKLNHPSFYSNERVVNYGGNNNAPQIITYAPGSNPTINEDQNQQFSATATDTDGDLLTFRWKVDGVVVQEETNMPSGYTSTYAHSEPASTTEQHSVAIFVYDGQGGADAWSWTLTITDDTPVAEAGQNQMVDEGESVIFDASASTGFDTPLSYLWNFNDGSPAASGVSVSHAYLDQGTFNPSVTVTDNDGSTDSDSMMVVVRDITPQVNSMPDQNVDEGDVVAFNVVASSLYPVADPITSYLWDFGDLTTQSGASLTSPTHMYSEDGVYTVSVRVYDEDNFAMQIMTVDVGDVDPNVSITDFSGVEGQNISFSVTATDIPSDQITSYEWDFGDGNSVNTSGPSVDYAYAQNGTYTLTVTVYDEDSSTVVIALVNVSDTIPTPDFTWNPLVPLEAQLIQFNDASTAYDGVVAWEWYFDGDMLPDSFLQSPQWSYLLEGAYNVTLIATDGDGSQASVTQTIVVGNDIPVVTVDADPLTGTEALLANVSCNATGGNAPFDYLVDFGDGNSDSIAASMATTFATSNIYVQNGTYSITCTVTDTDADVNQDNTTVIVVLDTVPVADFNWTPVNPDVFVNVLFTDISTAYDGVVAWEWDLDNDGLYDDGSASTALRQFYFPGTYTVNLRITDGDGSQSTVSHQINVTGLLDTENPQVFNVNIVPDPIITNYDANGLLTVEAYDNVDIMLNVEAVIDTPFGFTQIMPMTPLMHDTCRFYIQETGLTYTLDDQSVLTFSYSGSNYTVNAGVNGAACNFNVNQDGTPGSTTIVQGDVGSILGLTIAVMQVYDAPDVTGLCRVNMLYNGTNATSWLVDDGAAYTVPTPPPTNVSVTDVNPVNGCDLDIGAVSTQLNVGDSVNVNGIDVSVVDMVTRQNGLYYLPFMSFVEGNYTATINASDSAGNVNDTESTIFEIITLFGGSAFGDSLTNITAPVSGSTFNVTEVFDVNATISAVNGDLENCSADLSFNQSIFSILSPSSSQMLGNVTDGDNVSISWQVNATAVGGAEVYVTTTCTQGTSSSDSITINVNLTGVPANIPPVLDPLGDYTVNENETLVIDVNATDADNDTLTYATDFAQGVFDNATGILTWATNYGDAGNYSVTFNVTDGNGGWDSVTINVEVLDVPVPNNPPVFDPVGNYTVVENSTLILDVNATDADNDTLLYGTNATFGTFDTVTGILNWTPGLADAGNYTVLFTVADGNGGFDQIVVNIEVLDLVIPGNNPPVLDPLGNYTVYENDTLILDVNATDLDLDILTYGTNFGMGAFDTATGILNWTPGFSDAGNYTVLFTVTDGNGGFDSVTINIEVLDVPPAVNFPPVFDPVNNVTITENDTLILDVNATDANGDSLTYGTNATFGTFDTVTGILNWTPGLTDSGNYSIMFTVADGQGGFDMIVVNVEVLDLFIPGNTPPVFDPVSNVTITENDTLILDVNATDVDLDILTYGTNATFGTFDTVTGILNWTPGLADSGNYSILFMVADGQGGFDQVVVNVEVLDLFIPGNVPPVFDPVSNVTIMENDTLILDVNATDANGDPLTYGTNFSMGTFDTATGILNWTPSLIDAGNYSVLFTVADGNGGFDQVVVNIEVLDLFIPGNIPPVFDPVGNYTILENQTFVLDVNATDANGDPLTYGTNFTMGVFDTVNGILTWTPTFADAGNYSILFTVTDGMGGFDSIVANIEVLDVAPPVNNDPVIDPLGNYTVFEGQLLLIDVNATDADGDTLTYGTNFTYGTFNTSTGILSWTPGFNDAGNYTVLFMVGDGFGGFDQTVINVEVLDAVPPVNNPPVLDPLGNYSVNENDTLVIDVNATDLDLDVLTYGTDASSGVFDSNTGIYIWTPNFGDAGNYTVTFNVTDGTDSDSVTINIEVFDVPAPNNAPVLDALGNYVVNEGSPLLIDVNATDVDNDTLTYGTNFTLGSFDTNTGILLWTPNSTDAGNYSVQFIVSDGNGGFDSVTINIEVFDVPVVNNAPVLDPLGNATVWENQALVVDVNATDVDNDTLVFATDFAQGVFDINTGILSWTPNSTDAGNYSVTFNVTDGNGGWDSVTINIEVLDVAPGNNPPVFDPLGNYVVNEGSLLTVDANATDADNDTLTYGTNFTLGSFDTNTGILLWTPNSTDAGNYSVQFIVSDGNGGFDYVVINVEVLDVPGVNNPPVLDPLGNYTVTENSTLVIDVNATDVDNDTLVFATDFTQGVFDTNTGILTWTPNSTDAGNYTVTFNVTDGNGAWDFVTINIEVLGLAANNAPVMQPIGNRTIAEGTTLSIDVNATDADNDTLLYGTNATFGTFDTNTGIFNWTTNLTDAGVYAVLFTVSDGNGGFDSELIYITVTDTGSVPVAAASSNVTSGIVPFGVQFYGNATGGDGTLTYAWDLNGDGSFETSGQNPVYNYAIAGVYNVTLNVTDVDGDSSTDSIMITANAQVNDISVDTISQSKAASTVWLYDSLLIQSDVTNNGNVPETVTVELVIDGVVNQSQVISLSVAQTATVNFTWLAAPAGPTTAMVRSLAVPGETDLTNNAQSTSFNVESAEDVVSLSTREIFFNTTNVTLGGGIAAYLPVQNDYALTTYYDLIVALTGASSFTVSPATVQLITLSGGELKVVTWTMTANSIGSYNVGAYEGNNEVLIPSKLITVT